MMRFLPRCVRCRCLLRLRTVSQCSFGTVIIQLMESAENQFTEKGFVSRVGQYISVSLFPRLQVPVTSATAAAART